MGQEGEQPAVIFPAAQLKTLGEKISSCPNKITLLQFQISSDLNGLD
jgi:hypothetical protein